MKKLNLLIAAAGLVALAACDPIKGTLQVNQPLTLKLSNGQTTKLNPGGYSTELDFPSKDKITMTVKTANDDLAADIAVPKDSQLPSDNGRIHLPAGKTGQAWDLNGELHTKVTRSDDRRDYEQCVYYRNETVCDRRGRCRTVRRAEWGYQRVEYFFETEAKSLNLDLQAPGSKAALAHFAGTRTITSKIYRYRGYCR